MSMLWRASLTGLLALSVALCEAQEEAPQAEGAQPRDPWKAFVESGKWREGEAHYLRALVAECRRKDASLKAVAPLYFGLTVCRQFPRIKERVLSDTARKEFVAWLLENREFTRAFLSALRDQDNEARSFQILHSLLQSSEKQVKQYPQLAIAFAVVWDTHPPNRSFLQKAFAYYTRGPGQMRFDLRGMPHQVSRYVIDSRRPIAERVWAAERYGGSANVGRLYTIIKYNVRALARGEAGIRDHPHTLQNIREYGGLCHDQAVFASEVGKAVGVPSAYIAGGTQSGIEHAWVGFLRKRTHRYVWDRDTGRIGKADESRGWIIEPQSGLRRPEHDLDLALAALRYPKSARFAAHVWCAVAGILLQAKAPAEAAEAMQRSLKACVHDRQQWETFARLARAGAIPEQTTLKAVPAFAEKLESYPPLAAEAFARLVSTLKDTRPETVIRLHEAMAQRFEKDPEVVGRIRLLQARHIEAQGEVAAATRVYAEAALETVSSRSAVLPLLDNAARLMLERRRPKEAIALHEKAFVRADKPDRNAYAIHSTWFNIGLRLAKLRALAGNRAAHDRLVRRICGYQRMGRKQREALIERLALQKYSEINTSSGPLRPVD